MFKLGDSVEIINDHGKGREEVIGTGVVEKIWLDNAYVRSDKGRVMVYRQRDGRMNGYEWPLYVGRIRHVSLEEEVSDGQGVA